MPSEDFNRRSVEVALALPAVAAALGSSYTLTHNQVLDLIREIDALRADMDFTQGLMELAKELMAEEW